MTTKYGVIATPPKSGLFSDLKPRFQMWVDGSTVTYLLKEDAEEWAKTCNADRNGWTYHVAEVV